MFCGVRACLRTANALPSVSCRSFQAPPASFKAPPLPPSQYEPRSSQTTAPGEHLEMPRPQLRNPARPVFSDIFIRRITRGLLDDIDLLVCDMAGTTVEEGGMVYQVLRESMVARGLDVSEHDMHPWHGAKKEAVIEHFIRKAGDTAEAHVIDRVNLIGEEFLAAIDDAYFADASPIDHIDLSLIQHIRMLQMAGVKVALDTGYPREIQLGLMKKMKFDQLVDGSVSAYMVKRGRPYPYMIFRLMEDCDVMDVKRVAKAGDSVRDMEEGRNAGCGLVIGVLSGADNEADLLAAGADVIISRITDLAIPARNLPPSHALPIDLS